MSFLQRRILFTFPRHPHGRFRYKWTSKDTNEFLNSRQRPANYVNTTRMNLFTWSSALFFCSVGGTIYGLVYFYDKFCQSNFAKNSAVSQTTVENFGKPLLGGDWRLINCKNGKIVSNSDLKGKFQLIYFGFTFCPDVCPEELHKIVKVFEKLKAHFGSGGGGGLDRGSAHGDTGVTGAHGYGDDLIVPVFVTVDPKRDSLKSLADYCREFSEDILPLTGTEKMIKKAAKLFRVYYHPSVSTEGAEEGAEDYLVDHSIIHYLVGPDGKFIDFYGKNLTADEMFDKIRIAIDTENQKLVLKRRKKREAIFDNA